MSKKNPKNNPALSETELDQRLLARYAKEKAQSADGYDAYWRDVARRKADIAAKPWYYHFCKWIGKQHFKFRWWCIYKVISPLKNERRTIAKDRFHYPFLGNRRPYCLDGKWAAEKAKREAAANKQRL